MDAVFGLEFLMKYARVFLEEMLSGWKNTVCSSKSHASRKQLSPKQVGTQVKELSSW